MTNDARWWRRAAGVAGLTRADDLPLLLWPMLWSAWLATAGHPEPWRLVALLLAVMLARSAAWSGFLPEAPGVAQVWRARRFLLLVFAIGSLCFALPLGAPGSLVPLALLLVATWFQVRRRSYLSDPLLAIALMLLPLAAWLVQGCALTKSAGLLLLAAGLWVVSVVMAQPLERSGATLALLAEPHSRTAAALLRAAALIALWLAGRQAGLGLYFLLGLAAAAAVSAGQWRFGARLPPWGWEAAWGAAVFSGLLVR